MGPLPLLLTCWLSLAGTVCEIGAAPKDYQMAGTERPGVLIRCWNSMAGTVCANTGLPAKFQWAGK
jgi:hypothetical protein